MRTLLPLILLVLLTAACGLEPIVPPGAITTGTPAAAPLQAERGRHWLGVNVNWHTVGSDEIVLRNAGRILDYVVGLKANSVAIAFPIFTDGLRPTRVYADPAVTPSVHVLDLLLAEAHKRNLRILVRPLIDEANLKPSWRGELAPVDAAAWFRSYLATLTPYLKAAQRGRAAGFSIGSELNSLAGLKAGWKYVRTGAARHYKGRISYAANHDQWAGRASDGLAPALDVDAYPRLALPDNASVAALTRGWSAFLAARPAALLRRTVIEEIGIPPQAGAYANPHAYLAGRPALPRVQRNWFTAACAAARAAKVAGMFFWAVDSEVDPADPHNQAGSFIGKGDAQIRACFAGWAR